MDQQDEWWYAGRWQRRSEQNEQVWQKAVVKIERLADEGGLSTGKREKAMLVYRQHLLGWRDQ